MDVVVGAAPLAISLPVHCAAKPTFTYHSTAVAARLSRKNQPCSGFSLILAAPIHLAAEEYPQRPSHTSQLVPHSPKSQVEWFEASEDGRYNLCLLFDPASEHEGSRTVRPDPLASESRTVDSSQDSASANTQETPYPFTVWEPKSTKATPGTGTQDSAPANTEETPYPSTAWEPKSSTATPDADASGTGTGSSPASIPEADPEEIRRLRNQFLDKRLSETGKKGRRQPRTFTTPVLR
ncbi:hypothetical protein PG984_000556 [Apiospora sp. TS-2023a]